MLIKLSPFGGITPRTGERLLADTGAQIASNVKLQSGELRPLHQPGFVYLPAAPKTAPPLSIFRARNGSADASWFSWPIDVDCVRVPLATDVESRFCWTGDGPPKMVTYTNAISGAGNNYPLLANELSLGIPTPQTAPTVTPSATGTGSTVSRFYRYTFFSQNGEESAPSPVSLIASGKLDDTWALAALDEVPANSGVGTATATRFTNTALKHWLRVGDEVYFAGAPTVARTVTAIFSATAFDVTGASIVAETAWSRKTPWNTSGMVKRVYRTTGSTGSWQLVNETGIAAATTTYNDTLTDALIAGDELISEGWEPPRVGLHSLCVHPSGALLGISGNLLCASEPYQPHAWVRAYELASAFDGVGLSVFGATVVMPTAGQPFVASGVEPASMTGENVQGVYPCLAKRSVVGVGSAVLYASMHGLVSVGAQGVSIFTEPWYTRDEWEALNPETMICETASGRLYVAYTPDSGAKQMLVFDGPLLTDVSVEADELYTDVATGNLYIGDDAGISLFDSPTEVVLSGNWRSKEFVLPAPANLGAAKIDFDVAIDAAQEAALLVEIAAAEATNAAIVAAGNANGSINATQINCCAINGSDFVPVPDAPAANTVTFNLWQGDTLKASRVVSNTKAFRLPGGYKADNYSVEVITQCRVKEIRVAETMDGLRGA